jgi:hypothetical protein
MGCQLCMARFGCSLRKSRLASSFGKNQVCRCYGFGAALNGTFHMSDLNLGAASLEFNV